MQNTRLIYVANARFPTQKAHGVQIAQNICEFVRQNVQVTLVVPDRKNDLPIETPFAYYGLSECSQVVRVWVLDWIDFFKPVGFFVEQITFAFSTFFYLLKESQETIIYGRDEFVFALVKLFVPNRKVFYELHDYPENSCIFWHWLFKKLDGVISTNNWKREQLIKILGVKSEKIIVARNGFMQKDYNISDDKSLHRRELNLHPDKIIVGYVGKLKTKGAVKGVEEIKETVKLLDKNENVALEIVTNAPHALVPKYLKAFDILLMPFPDTLHYAHYMSPIKMFEYMAAGRAIIATNLPSIREVLNDSNSVLIESSEPRAIALAIEKLVRDTNLRERLGQNAKRDSHEFTLDKRVDSIIKFIQDTK